MLIDILGWLGATLLGGCAVPQAWHSFKTKSSVGISWIFAGMWGIGEIVTICYIIVAGIWTVPLLANYAINLACLVVIVWYMIYPQQK